MSQVGGCMNFTEEQAVRIDALSGAVHRQGLELHHHQAGLQMPNVIERTQTGSQGIGIFRANGALPPRALSSSPQEASRASPRCAHAARPS